MKMITINLANKKVPLSVLEKMTVIYETLPELPANNSIVRKTFAGEMGDLYQMVKKQNLFESFCNHWLLDSGTPIYSDSVLSVREKFAILAVTRGLSRYFSNTEYGNQAKLFAQVLSTGFSSGIYEQKMMKEILSVIEQTPCSYAQMSDEDEVFVAKVETFCHLFPQLFADMMDKHPEISNAMSLYDACQKVDDDEKAQIKQLFGIYFNNGWVYQKRKFGRINNFRRNAVARTHILQSAFHRSSQNSKELASVASRHLHWEQKSPANWVSV